jgi:hypothetical protein
LRPFAETPIPDPDFPYHSGEAFFEESPRAFVGLSGESRTADANSPYFRTQAGSGPTVLVSPGKPGENLYGQLDLPINGVRPARPAKQPEYRPNVPCENQEPPNLNAPGGTAGEQATPQARRRETPKEKRQRAEQYRRLREYADRTRKGLPALDPFEWWGVGERNQLKRMGLMRDENGKLVKRRKR